VECHYTLAKCLCSFKGRVLGTRYGPGSGKIWTEYVSCDGDETGIGDCHYFWGQHICQHWQDVSISCDDNGLTADAPDSETTDDESVPCRLILLFLSLLLGLLQYFI